MDVAEAEDNPRLCADLFHRDGLLHVRGILPAIAASALATSVGQELRRRQSAGDASWFGDVYGYEDTGKRWDMKLMLTDEVRIALSAIMLRLQMVLETLRPSWQLAELAAMCTFPGDPGQPVHSDTSHIFDPQVVTIFVALHDIAVDRGPTRFYPGTHTNKEVLMGYTERDEKSAVLGTMACGDCVMMDSRLLHCGTANESDEHRFLFYSSWMPPVRRPRGSTNTILEEHSAWPVASRWNRQRHCKTEVRRSA